MDYKYRYIKIDPVTKEEKVYYSDIHLPNVTELTMFVNYFLDSNYKRSSITKIIKSIDNVEVLYFPLYKKKLKIMMKVYNPSLLNNIIKKIKEKENVNAVQ